MAKRIINNIKNADACTKASIAPLAILGVGALASAITTPWHCIIAVVCFGLCAIAYAERNK